MLKNEWEDEAAKIVKAELARRGLSYEDLRLALEKIGVQKSTHNVAKTINLGKFSLAFFLQVAKAIGLNRLQFNHLNEGEVNLN